ncbi:general transcription factor IIF subunit 2-like [Xenopus laevis]|uniref:General transcription factor IIF subunit 2-like n=1 Tax=Xenopus laevis TaxID=8355 RepID=A0A8J0U4L1_XENLA|nr:general transcription factor IIF subunit 2-like [Xenopus laevis]
MDSIAPMKKNTLTLMTSYPLEFINLTMCGSKKSRENRELASIQDIGGKPASSIVTASREHPLCCSQWGDKLSVFTESLSDKLALEGIVVNCAECRPAASENYMQMKRKQIEESSKPKRQSQQKEKAVTTNYRPLSNHQYNIYLKEILRDIGIYNMKGTHKGTHRR